MKQGSQLLALLCMAALPLLYAVVPMAAAPLPWRALGGRGMPVAS